VTFLKDENKGKMSHFGVAISILATSSHHRLTQFKANHYVITSGSIARPTTLYDSIQSQISKPKRWLRNNGQISSNVTIMSNIFNLKDILLTSKKKIIINKYSLNRIIDTL